MNVRPGIITEEQAAFITTRWWRAAKAELIAWAICFALGWAFVVAILSAFHLVYWQYWAVAGASLLLFSRLAIWVTFIPAVLIHVAFCAAGHPQVANSCVIAACIFAVLLRSPFFLFFFLVLASSMRAAARHTQVVCAEEEPTYDPQTDQLVFRSGRREPAFLNPLKARELPEPAAEYFERRDQDFFEERDRDFFEDLKQHQDRERRAREDHFRN
jgi:hypothetical protein